MNACGGGSTVGGGLSSVVQRLSIQRSRTWEPEHMYDTINRMKKCCEHQQRRQSSAVVCLLGGGGDRQKSRKYRRRSQSFCERQLYKPLPWKSMDINVRLPDGTRRTVVGDDRMQVWDLVAPLAAELRVAEPRLYMAGNGAPVDGRAPVSLLEGDELILEEGKTPWDARSANDDRLKVVEEVLSTEKDYSNTLRTVCDLYEKPLRKLLCMEKEDYKSFFDWVDPICSLSRMVTIKLTVAVDEWESYQTKVGNIFSKLVWNKYEEYLNLYTAVTLPLLRERQNTDEDFVALCRLRQGAAKYSLEDLLRLPLERLAQYERYLSLLAEQTPPDHPDYNDICRTAAKAASMVKRADAGREESDLDRIQDLFPSDSLRLHERDPLSPRKGLMRSKSSAAAKIQKNLSTKAKSPNGDIISGRNETSTPQKRHLWGDDNFRVFIMESPVQFAMGVQKQERHLFLFNDLLLIAKPRSGGTYKLKEKVRLCEMWISHCVGDVCELFASPATSFVVGWPTTNVVVTFSSVTTKELWQQKLLQLLQETKEKEGKTVTSVQISFRSPETYEEIYKTLKVDNKHTAQECIKLLLQQLRLPDCSIKDYKLWVKTGKDDAPYPLIGHEYPFSIKMNFIRELLRRSDLDLRNFNNFSTDSKCYFILRKNTLNSSIRADPRSPKKRKKHRRPHNKINWLFRRQGQKQDSVDSGNGSPPPGGLFGQPLWKICPDNTVPKQIMSMLLQLFRHGPYTVGIFRKSANARACREFKEKLKVDPDFDMSTISVIILASVFKEFLRSLPDCLLQSEMYRNWLQVVACESEWERKKRVLNLLAQLPPANMLMLQYTLCVLWHIAQHSSENKMPSSNLAVCIGPSILNPGSLQSSAIQQEDVAKKVPKAVAYLIDHCTELFGENILCLLGPFPERNSSRQDSGAEESDSLHSLQELTGNYRRDDSSIDSLDRDFMDDIEASPKLPCKSKMSLTNLSRDSGLTLSDTQLYTPEEEIESESSSADSRRGHAASLTKSVPHLDTAGLDNTPGTYTKNAGVSIDGSCHDVVRKRRQCIEHHRTKNLTACASLPYSQVENHYGGNPHVPLQFSQSYSYSMQQDLMGHCVVDSPRDRDPFAGRRKVTRGRSYGDRPLISTTNVMDHFTGGTLRRSASEESLLQNYANPCPPSNQAIAEQRKRRAPSPPLHKNSISAPCSERKQNGSVTYGAHNGSSMKESPDRHAVWFAIHSRRADWKRSQSTSKIDELDQAHDSSTLSLVSSDDSTPHVSRSNSRVQELSSQSHGDLCNIYCASPRVNSVCSSTSDGSHQSQNSRGSMNSNKSNSSHKSRKSNCSMNGTGIKPGEPPSYIETINRQTILKHLQQPVVLSVTDEMRAEQTSLSAKARELYENSVRLYVQQIPTKEETHRAVPATVDGSSESRNIQTSAKSTQTTLRATNDNFHPRLRHLPPVHVTDAQLSHRLRNFQIKPRHPAHGVPDDLRNEINWSVAQLRDFFSRQQQQEGGGGSNAGQCMSYCKSHSQKSEDILSHSRQSQHRGLHTRSRSLSSRSEEESFV